MTKYAFERTHAGYSFAGVIEVPQTLAVDIAIDDILTIAASNSTEEFIDQILYLPP
jgi:hypothetical protein